MSIILEKFLDNVASHPNELSAEITERERFKEQLQGPISSQPISFSEFDGILSCELDRRAALAHSKKMRRSVQYSPLWLLPQAGVAICCLLVSRMSTVLKMCYGKLLKISVHIWYTRTQIGYRSDHARPHSEVVWATCQHSFSSVNEKVWPHWKACLLNLLYFVCVRPCQYTVSIADFNNTAIQSSLWQKCDTPGIKMWPHMRLLIWSRIGSHFLNLYVNIHVHHISSLRCTAWRDEAQRKRRYKNNTNATRYSKSLLLMLTVSSQLKLHNFSLFQTAPSFHQINLSSWKFSSIWVAACH